MGITVKEIEHVQTALFGRIQSELENGYENAIHDSYQSRVVLQFAQTIDILEKWKATCEIE